MPPFWTENPSFAEFAPGEAAQITGLSTDLQRVWRKRRQLPPGGTRAKFSALDVAALLVRQKLSERGLSPKDSAEIGEQAAPLVLYFALMECDARCEVFGEEPAVDTFEAAYFNDDRVVAQLANVSDVQHYVAAIDDRPPTLVRNVDTYRREAGGISGYFVSLEEVGRKLGERAIKPLVRVRLIDPPGEEEPRIVRRLMMHARFTQRRKRRLR